MSISGPLVSVGMPIYNRPEAMRKAIDSVLNQTYRNIEIIISDNASPDGRVHEIIENYCLKDSRIKFYRQEKNLGPSQNFFFVLKQSVGKYFVWAADDDWRESWVIERCVSALERDDRYIAAMTETQYVIDENTLLPFFSEGRAFYRDSRELTLEERVRRIIDHNYGDLIYAVFRRDALMIGNDVFWEKINYKSLNEIAPLIYAATKGDFLVFPEVGMYKRVPRNVYDQARWEMEGGRLASGCRVNGCIAAINTCRYHKLVMDELRHALREMPIDPKLQKCMIRRIGYKLLMHCISLLLGYKFSQGEFVNESA